MIQPNQDSLNSNPDNVGNFNNIDNFDNLDIQNKLNQKVDKIGNFSLNMLRSIGIWRSVGYVFLLLFALDLAEILIPPQFLNPQWEFQVLSALVERIAIPFIALLLIFSGGNYLRKGWEFITLMSLSWISLFSGILFLLFVPLGIVNTIRIDALTNQQIEKENTQRLEVLQKVEIRLRDVQNSKDMQTLIGEINAGNAPIIENSQQLGEVKTKFKEFIDNSRVQTNKQAEIVRKQGRKALLKRSVKYNTGSLISGVLFIMIWQMTKWARVKDKINN